MIRPMEIPNQQLEISTCHIDLRTQTSHTVFIENHEILKNNSVKHLDIDLY